MVCLLFVPRLSAPFVSFVLCDLFAICALSTLFVFSVTYFVYIFRGLLCLYLPWLALFLSFMTFSIYVFCDLFAIYALSALFIFFVACQLYLYLGCSFYLHLLWLALFISFMTRLIYFYIVNLI